MSHVLLKSLLMVYTAHSLVIASSSSSSANSAANSVVSTPKFPAINVKRALMLPPDPPPMGLDDNEATKKATFASKSDREKAELLTQIYEAYKRLIEPEKESVSLQNEDGSPRIILRTVVDMTTATFEGDVVMLMITDKTGHQAKYRYNKKTNDLAVAPSPRLQCSQAWV